MRAQEAVHLEREDVDSDRRAIHLSVTKTNRPRSLSWKTQAGDFEPVLAEAAGDGFLFTSSNGGAYKQFSNNFHDLVERVASREKKAGRKFRPFRAHDLRHLFAVRWMRQGGSVYRLSKHLGHSEIATTEIYLDYLTEDEKAVAQGVAPAAVAA